MQSRILLAGTDAATENIVDLLRSRGFRVDMASTGETVLSSVRSQHPALIVLSLELPDADGCEICRQVRQMSALPIIALSDRKAESDKVHALELGADDYVTKPFGSEELVARIRAILRRVSGARPQGGDEPLRVGDLTIDYRQHRVFRRDKDLRLTPKEFDLLRLLARNADTVLTSRSILRAIWGPRAVNEPEHLWTLVSSLRKKLEPDSSGHRYLINEPAIGYRLETSNPQRTAGQSSALGT